MSVPGPFGGGGDPFEGIPIFRDLAKMFTAAGPVNWEIARQVAVWIAADGQSEPNIDPLERIRLEELARVAELHVANATGLSITGGAPAVVPVTKSDWALRSLDAYRPLLERLATALGDPTGGADPADPTTDLLGNLGALMGPVLVGMQSGFTVGHLARGAFGQYGLPVPRPMTAELVVVPANIVAFASDWSLPEEDLLLWVCVSELTHHTVITRPHVRARLEQLLSDYAAGFRADPTALEGKLGDIDPTDTNSLQAVLGDPETLLGAMQTPEQRATLVQLEAMIAAIEGYVDHVVDTVGRPLIASYDRLTEALRRQRVQRGEGEKFVERLFGLELGQAQFERGAAFVRGVIERKGDEGLARLWRSEYELPTPAEVDAPGLWLERIDLPES